MNYGLRYKAQLDPYVVAELEGFIVALNEMLAVSIKEDGTIKDPADADNDLEPPALTWVRGPLIVGDDAHTSLDLATGTYDDLGPSDIDTAVLFEIEPQGGNVTIGGLKNPSPDVRRLLLLRNRDTTHSLILEHEEASSIEQYRFSLPGAADFTVGPNSSYWLFYDRSRKRWTVVAT